MVTTHTHTHTHTCVFSSLCTCVCTVYILYTVYLQRNLENRLLKRVEWMYKPLVSLGSDTPAQTITELMLECHSTEMVTFGKQG